MKSRKVLRSILRRCENAAVTTRANSAGSLAMASARTLEKSTGIMRTMAESTLGGGLKDPGGTMNRRSMW